MTTAEMLASLEAQIRKDIPRLMELREGCIIKYFRDGRAYNCKVVETFPSYFNVYFDGEIESIDFDYLDKNVYEIIGHDIMLNDVLEWLFYTITKKAVIVFDVDVFGVRAYYPQRDSDRYIDATKRIKIDFFTPYLKDQSDELIKFLYNLKKE